jgi:hypothetical protein
MRKARLRKPGHSSSMWQSCPMNSPGPKHVSLTPVPHCFYLNILVFIQLIKRAGINIDKLFNKF